MSDAEKAAEDWMTKQYGAIHHHRIYAAEHAAFLAGYAAAQTWRPIESAPRDGTRILAINVCNPTRQFVLYYSERHGSLYPWVYSGAPMDFVGGITHWMPLPKPPEAG